MFSGVGTTYHWRGLSTWVGDTEAVDETVCVQVGLFATSWDLYTIKDKELGVNDGAGSRNCKHIEVQS